VGGAFMQIKLNCFNQGILQGTVKKLVTDGERSKFLIKSKNVTMPCRVDCRVPEGLKEGDFVTVHCKLRYSNDYETHKLILEKIMISEFTNTPVNHFLLEGYMIETINTGKGVFSWMFRHNALRADGDLYRCLIEVVTYGKIAERLTAFVKPDSLYIVTGELINSGKKVVICADHVKDSKAINRDI
jgi:hypothetical protein